MCKLDMRSNSERYHSTDRILDKSRVYGSGRADLILLI